nr:MAG TPA: hypothetical protein [Caudoviricetes sp.]
MSCISVITPFCPFIVILSPLEYIGKVSSDP